MRLFFTYIFLALAQQLFAQNEVSYSFFVAGHSSGTPGIDNPGLHPPFKKHFPFLNNHSNLQLGILTGDIVRAFPYPTTKDWEEVDMDLSELNIPVHFAVGNHDMENRPAYESRYGSTYFSFTHQNDLFLFLDPNLDNWNITGDQLSFLKTILDTTNASNIYVFTHQVLWSYPDNLFNYIKWNSSEGRASEINFWNEIIPLFQRSNKPVYFFAGDVGSAPYASPLSYDKVANFTFISSGMGNNTNENYLIVNVDNNKNLTYDVMCISDPDSNCLGQLEDHLRVDIPISYPFTHEANQIKIFNHKNNPESQILLPWETEGVFRIFNINGQLVLQQNFTHEFIIPFDVALLEKGMYIAEIDCQKGIFREKFFLN